MSLGLNKKDIKKFLENVAVMSIAVNYNDSPISSIVIYTIDDDLSFYFLTKRNTYKSQALSQNPKISVSVWAKNKMLVQSFGSVIEIPHGDEFDKYYMKLESMSDEMGNKYWPLSAVEGEEYVVYKILTEWLRVMDLSKKTKETPYQIIDL